MKITISIVKQEIKKNQDNFVLTAEVVVKQGKNKLFDFPITARYKTMEGLKDKVNGLIAIEYDRYQECRAEIKSDALTKAIADITRQSTSYVNKAAKK